MVIAMQQHHLEGHQESTRANRPEAALPVRRACGPGVSLTIWSTSLSCICIIVIFFFTFAYIFGYLGKLDPSLAGQRQRKPHICLAFFCMPKLVVCGALW